MKNRLIVLFVVLLFCMMNMSHAADRTKYNFNPDWKLYIGDDPKAKNVFYNDSKWKAVNLPEAFNEEQASKVSIEQLQDTVAWYRKKFEISSQHRDQKIFIEFEGVGQAAEVWVNEKPVGLYKNGVTAFGFDITRYVTFGRKINIIAVRVRNSFRDKEGTSGVSPYGGLNKNVWLYTTNKLYQTLPLYNNLKTKGVYIYADNFDVNGKRALLHIESEVRNEYSSPKIFRLNVMVRDNEGLLVREFQSKEDTIQPGETKVVTASGVMKNVQFWSWGYGYLYEVNTSLTVDKEVMDFVRTRTGFRKTAFDNGMFKLNDRALQLKGYAQNSANEWPIVGSSVPAWLSDYSNNLMVESNANLVRWMHATPWKQDVESCDRIGLMEVMPVGDYGKDVNEGMWAQRKEEMKDAIIYNRNNPSIVFYECGNSGISEEQMSEMLAVRDECDPHGGRVIGAPGMLDSKVAEYSGEMSDIDKSAGKPFFAMAYCRDELLRKDLDQDMFAMETVVRWYDFYRERIGTGRRVSAGGVNYAFSDSSIPYTGTEGVVNNGKVDAMRIKKEAWWAHYVMWDGWVDIEKVHSHIVGHWNYNKGTKNNVYVISSGDKVQLFLNDRSLGFGEQTSRFLFTFKDVAFEPGILRAVSYDASDKQIGDTTCETAGIQKSLKMHLIQSPDGFTADGADMILIELEVVDANGQRCPLANDTVGFEVKGPVEFIGGPAQGTANFVHSKSLPVEAGVNRILLRSTKEAGNITVIARSGNLISDTLNVRSKSVLVKNGLSEFFPVAKLVSSLTRGGTPLVKSYQVSRIPVSVDRVTAGSNEKEAVFSIDDNERTEWRNTGPRSTAWIKYDLSRQSSLSEISIKLADWRTRSYPIRILSEDGTVLWKGTTEKSLGYITLSLKKGVLTKSVKVELLGADGEKDSFASLSDELRIVEIEFYETPD
jgi:beta-galactosidase